MKTLISMFVGLFVGTSMLAQDYSMSLSNTRPYVGEKITYTWTTHPSAYTLSDTIRVYPAGNPSGYTVIYTITSTGKHAGTNTYIPYYVGDYEMQYYDRYGVALTAPLPFSVRTGSEAYALTLGTNQADLNTQVSVSWRCAPYLYLTNDVVGCFRDSKPGSFYLYVPVEFRTNATTYFTMALPGTYWFGYFKGGSISNPVTPLQKLSVLYPPPTTLSVQKIGSNVRISWQARQGPTNLLESTTNLAAFANWTVVKTFTGANTVLSYTNSTAGQRKFFRVREAWP